MAKNKNQAQNADTSVDELLDGAPEATAAERGEGAQEGAEGTEQTEEEDELDKQIKAKMAELKALKAAKKGTPVKPERTLKGQWVAFKNKAGEQIVGLGTLYYVARAGGKLHYKEASQVQVLPADWKEGDPIPEMPEQTEGQSEEQA